MSRLFTATSQQYLLRSIPLTTIGLPITIAGWFLPLSGSGAGCPFGFSNSANAASAILVRYLSPSGPLQALYGRGPYGIAATTVNIVPDTWNHAVAVFTSVTSRSAYINGAGLGTDTTDVTTGIPGIDRIAIGAFASNTPDTFMNGYLGEWAGWNAALGPEEIDALYKGWSPLLVRPGALFSYWPIFGVSSPEPDTRGNYDLVLINNPVGPAGQPRIIRPQSPVYYR